LIPLAKKIDCCIENKVFKLDISGDYQDKIGFIASEVRNKGFFILENTIPKDMLAEIIKEYDSLFELEESNFYRVDKSGDGAVCLRVKPFWTIGNSSNIRKISGFYNSKAFKDIAVSFYKSSFEKINYISEIFVHKTVETTAPISGGLHWDRAQTLKFWIYLNDLEVENGPMRVERGSGSSNAKIREGFDDTSKLVGQVDNIIEVDNPQDIVYLTAPAGSIIIHDTDASHGASPVAPGCERKIIRGHCRLQQ
jgi:hypothetical protein